MDHYVHAMKLITWGIIFISQESSSEESSSEESSSEESSSEEESDEEEVIELSLLLITKFFCIWVFATYVCRRRNQLLQRKRLPKRNPQVKRFDFRLWFHKMETCLHAYCNKCDQHSIYTAICTMWIKGLSPHRLTDLTRLLNFYHGGCVSC